MKTFDPKAPFFLRDGVVRRMDSGDDYDTICEVYWSERRGKWVVLDEYGDAEMHARLWVVNVPMVAFDHTDDCPFGGDFIPGSTVPTGSTVAARRRSYILVFGDNIKTMMPEGAEIHEDSGEPARPTGPHRHRGRFADRA